MSIQMNHLFYVGKSLPTRKEDSKLQIGLLILSAQHMGWRLGRPSVHGGTLCIVLFGIK